MCLLRKGYIVALYVAHTMTVFPLREAGIRPQEVSVSRRFDRSLLS